MEIKDFINENTKFLAREGFVARDIAGETILVPVGVVAQNFTGMVQLNQSSAFVWNALKEPKTIAELVELLNVNFEISNDVDIKEDIMEFLVNGIRNQLILIIKKRESE